MFHASSLTPQQILDRAIIHDKGIVDFRMLYTLLHILINNGMAGMDTVSVEVCNMLNENECGFEENAIVVKHSTVSTINLVRKEEFTKTTKSFVANNVVKPEITKRKVITANLLQKSRSQKSMATSSKADATNKTVEEDSKEKENDNLSQHVTKDVCDERLTKLENVISNLTTSINDLTRNFHVLETTFAANDDVGRLTFKLKELESLYEELYKTRGSSEAENKSPEAEIVKKKVEEKSIVQKNSTEEVREITSKSTTDNSLNKEISVEKETTKENLIKKEDPGVNSKQDISSQLDALLKEVKQLKTEFQELKAAQSVQKPSSTIDESRLKVIEEKLSTFESIFDSLDPEKKKSKAETHDFDAVQANIHTIKGELEKLDDLSGFLLSEKENFSKQLEAINKQIETIKEEKTEELTTAKSDMNKNLTELIESLSEKETAWKQTIRDIQQVLGSKIDQHDILPLKSYIKSQIDQLHGQLSALEKMKEDNEAAGTRSKILQNVNCVSCNARAMMKRDENPCEGFMSNDGLRPILSLKPYLSYKPNAVKHNMTIRRPITTFPTSHRICEQNPISSAYCDPNYLCNRYCGGHHTKFNIYDRVSKCAFLRPCCNKRRF